MKVQVAVLYVLTHSISVFIYSMQTYFYFMLLGLGGELTALNLNTKAKN